MFVSLWGGYQYCSAAAAAAGRIAAAAAGCGVCCFSLLLETNPAAILARINVQGDSQGSQETASLNQVGTRARSCLLFFCLSYCLLASQLPLLVLNAFCLLSAAVSVVLSSFLFSCCLPAGCCVSVSLFICCLFLCFYLSLLLSSC